MPQVVHEPLRVRRLASGPGVLVLDFLLLGLVQQLDKAVDARRLVASGHLLRVLCLVEHALQHALEDRHDVVHRSAVEHQVLHPPRLQLVLKVLERRDVDLVVIVLAHQPLQRGRHGLPQRAQQFRRRQVARRAAQGDEPQHGVDALARRARQHAARAVQRRQAQAADIGRRHALERVAREVEKGEAVVHGWQGVLVDLEVELRRLLLDLNDRAGVEPSGLLGAQHADERRALVEARVADGAVVALTRGAVCAPRVLVHVLERAERVAEGLGAAHVAVARRHEAVEEARDAPADFATRRHGNEVARHVHRALRQPHQPLRHLRRLAGKVRHRPPQARQDHAPALVGRRRRPIRRRRRAADALG
eukprot:Unigene6365_Nuclearia_a/m.19618 Unigene6365_Nuclearia_a/g.19618  ORF Unigene6365_Nuclearia_a/g.19618 Unigene6365_Nuclearia_a/m.19618 type:complete len:363 (+) Unigene6365_Nuclearia_a:2255-3343(+)